MSKIEKLNIFNKKKMKDRQSDVNNPFGQSSLDNQPSIPLYDQENDKDPNASQVFLPDIVSSSQQKVETIKAKKEEEQKTWLGTICPLFSISYYLILDYHIVSTSRTLM